MKTGSAANRLPIPPAAIPPDYLPVKRRLMDGRKPRFAALRKLDARLRILEIAIFGLLWIAGSALALSASAFPPGLMRIAVQSIGIFFSGLALLAFFMEVHEAVHSVLFKNRWLYSGFMAQFVRETFKFEDHLLGYQEMPGEKSK